MKNIYKSFLKISGSMAVVIFLFAISISANTLYAQHDHSKHTNDMKMEQKTESIVREGKIDLKKIDENKDGKVFQDPMHWNVISDEAGKCPLCKMTLKEVTIKEAKKNLKKNGFEVKE